MRQTLKWPNSHHRHRRHHHRRVWKNCGKQPIKMPITKWNNNSKIIKSIRHISRNSCSHWNPVNCWIARKCKNPRNNCNRFERIWIRSIESGNLKSDDRNRTKRTTMPNRGNYKCRRYHNSKNQRRPLNDRCLICWVRETIKRCQWQTVAVVHRHKHRPVEQMRRRRWRQRQIIAIHHLRIVDRQRSHRMCHRLIKQRPMLRYRPKYNRRQMKYPHPNICHCKPHQCQYGRIIVRPIKWHRIKRSSIKSRKAKRIRMLIEGRTFAFDAAFEYEPRKPIREQRKSPKLNCSYRN